MWLIVEFSHNTAHDFIAWLILKLILYNVSNWHLDYLSRCFFFWYRTNWCRWGRNCFLTEILKIINQFFLFVWKHMRVSVQCCGYFLMPQSVSNHKGIVALIDKKGSVCLTFIRVNIGQRKKNQLLYITGSSVLILINLILQFGKDR